MYRLYCKYTGRGVMYIRDDRGVCYAGLAYRALGEFGTSVSNSRIPRYIHIYIYITRAIRAIAVTTSLPV